MSKPITFSVHTIEGDTATMEAPPEERLEAVFHRAIHELGIDPSLAANYYLAYNGQQLDLAQSLAQAGIGEGAELILTSQPQVG
jgi:hypothetical protein